MELVELFPYLDFDFDYERCNKIKSQCNKQISYKNPILNKNGLLLKNGINLSNSSIMSEALSCSFMCDLLNATFYMGENDIEYFYKESKRTDYLIKNSTNEIIAVEVKRIFKYRIIENFQYYVDLILENANTKAYFSNRNVVNEWNSHVLHIFTMVDMLSYVLDSTIKLDNYSLVVITVVDQYI